MSQYITKIRTNQGDMQIDYNALANLPTLSQGGAGSHNIFINGEFLVWQRGDRFTNIANRYAADRWYIGNAKSSTSLVEKSMDVPEDQIMRQSIHIQESVEENTYLTYYFEQVFKGTLTLSFWYKTSAPFNTFIEDGGKQVPLGKLETLNTWTKAEFKIDATSMTRLDLIHAMSVGDTYIAGAKLEYGGTATEFIPRQPAEELALCQRFFCKIKSICPMFMTQQALLEKKYSNMAIPLPVSQRSKPKIAFDHVKLMENGTDGLQYAVQEIECVGWSRLGVTLRMYLNEYFKSGTPYFLMMDEDGYIDLDAEVYPAT